MGTDCHRFLSFAGDANATTAIADSELRWAQRNNSVMPRKLPISMTLYRPKHGCSMRISGMFFHCIRLLLYPHRDIVVVVVVVVLVVVQVGGSTTIRAVSN